MPRFTTRTINSAFEIADEGADYPDVERAYRNAIRAGIDMAAEEVNAGAMTGAIEVFVEDFEGKQVAKGVVLVSASRLCLG